MRNLLLALKKSIINTIYSLLKKNERIIRINSHDNQIKLFFNKKKKLYIKLSNGKFGNECLIREYAGNKWYYNKQGIKYNFVLKKDNFFYEFSRKEIIGYKKIIYNLLKIILIILINVLITILIFGLKINILVFMET